MDFSDLGAFVSLRRTTSLATSPDGTRLIATVQEADEARYVSSLWEIPTDGAGDAVRLTRAEKGETAPAFRPDGSLLFVSTRPAEGVTEDEAALWRLPPKGEPELFASTPGGLNGPVVAATAGTVVAAGSRLVGAVDAADDAERRRERKDRKITAILHTGMPIRYWDHELGAESPRLFVADGAEVRDLAPDAGFALTNADYSITADGSTVATTWSERRSRGRFRAGVVLIDVATGERTGLVRAADDEDCAAVRISPDGAVVALVRQSDGDFDTPLTATFELHPVAGGDALVVDLGDVFATDVAWAPDSRTVYVLGDWHGRTAVLAVDAGSGAVTRLADDSGYLSLAAGPDAVFALRTTVAAPPAPVRITPGGVVALADPAPLEDVPGSLHDVSVEVAGATVRGWLCLPADAADAPLMVFVHGGPFVSTNGWSWRWNPWPAVARGWAVLLPDPALSTGYGGDFLARAWPHRAGLVWRDIEALLDHVLATQPVDAGRTACLGGSFGGYMTNWIAGHTDRFGAIVTHAGLWALDQQHTTTDGAAWKSNLFGTPAEHPDWYAENSPHHSVDKIVTPMLVVHGNRDYRVPVSEALRLWWDLVSRWEGEPDELPHRFLQLTGENHWVLSPANARIWYETVLDFCEQHVLA